MKNSKFLQKTFFLLVAGISLSALQACEEKDELVLAPSIDREDMIESVDLGLPSGIRWASCNIGASSPEEYGDYFAWGETTVKGDYSWQTYQWCDGTYESMSTDCVDSIELSQQYDAALAKWGEQWRMPTMADFKELTTECTWTWTTQNGVKGYEVKGTNGNSIFLPAAGCRRDGTVLHSGYTGCYWSKTLYESDTQHAHLLYFEDNTYSYNFRNFRVDGRSVRAVTDGGNVNDEPEDGEDEENPSEGNKDEKEPSEDDDEVTDEPSEDREEFDANIYSGEVNGYRYVDLGLSVKWATCNVGAKSPEESGGYYAWGETEEKSEYSLDTYKWYKDSFYIKYCTNSKYGIVDNKIILEQSDDVAQIKWGNGWRMPTNDEFEELSNKCTIKWTTYNGIWGQIVTGANGNKIFLPAAGVHWGIDTIDFYGTFGGYRSATLIEASNHIAHIYIIGGPTRGLAHSGERERGLSVRPVCE